MPKQLTCECGTNCGEMRDGRFMKGAVVLCVKCAEQYRVLKMIQVAKDHQKDGGFDDVFKDVFGGAGDTIFGKGR